MRYEPSKQETKYVGMSTSGFLLVAFIVLKLCGVINWNWLWVLAPLWIPFAIVFVILACCVLYALIADEVDKRRIRKATERKS